MLTGCQSVMVTGMHVWINSVLMAQTIERGTIKWKKGIQ